MLSKSDIRFLSEAGKISTRKTSIHEIANEFGWSDSYASRVISGLQKRGYVRTERDKREKSVSLTDIRPVAELRALTSEFGHVDFPELIAGTALKILYYLDHPRTASELTERSHVSRGTVYRRLDSLQRVGIVGKDHSKYELTEPFSGLSDFARAVAHHEHRQEALEQTTNVNIVWETHDEYLFGCDSEVIGDKFYPTGPSVFEEFDVPLFTRERVHYFRSERLSELTATDLVCHTLLIDNSTRYRTYCLLLISSQDMDPSTLDERARYYNREADLDVTALVAELLEYLESKGEQASERLPAWEEFNNTATGYDISL